MADKMPRAVKRSVTGEQYQAEVNNGEGALAKRRGDGVAFDSTLVGSSAKSVCIKIEKE